MRIALSHLEGKFRALLDSYCFSMEKGQFKQAEEASAKAEDFLEAIEILKFVASIRTNDISSPLPREEQE